MVELTPNTDCIVLENLFDDFFNECIQSELKKVQWILSTDTLADGYSDAGFLHYSLNLFNPNKKPEMNKLNFFGEIITKKIKDNIPNLEDHIIIRYLWNYYNRSSTGTFHQDEKTNDFVSVIYYVNTCDGGTIVGDKFIKSESGKAVIFPSTTLHRGVGPKEDLQRYVLNILLHEE